MYKEFRIGASILMAGIGERAKSEIPKQFLKLGNKKVYLHTLDVFLSAQIFDEIVLVVPRDYLSVVAEEVKNVTIVEGGKTRQESSFLGIQGFRQKPDIVVIHDAVRPFVTKEIIIANVEQAIVHGAVDTCIPSADTLVFSPDQLKIEKIPKREEFFRGQTPQTFRYETLLKAHGETKLRNATDDCAVVMQAGTSVYIVIGNEENFKITNSFDVKLARLLLSNN